MPSRLLSLLSLFGCFVSVPLLAQSPVSRPEQPLKVYLFTDAPSDPDDDESLARTTEEVTKRVGDRDRWFEVVAERNEAELVIEVLRQHEGRAESATFVTRTETTDQPDRQLTRFRDVGKAFTLETRVRVGEDEPFELTVTSEGKRFRDLARPYALRLETLCRMNYATIREALQRPGS